MTPALQVESLSSGYQKVPVLRDVNLQVGAGEVVALLGANGAGKTTTLLSVCGLVERLGGSVRVGGRELGRMRPHQIARLGCAHVTEDRALFDGLSVWENLRVVVPRSEIKASLERFPALLPLLDRRAGLLSGGEQQMLAIARALASRPRLLMIDEMSLGLAPLITKDLLVIVAAIASDTGCGVLLVEQHVHLALQIAHRGYVLSRGRVVLDGTAEELLANRHVVEESYLGHAAAASEEVLNGTR
jgi:branched-chain amino acid transport system ATP-binding protein